MRLGDYWTLGLGDYQTQAKLQIPTFLTPPISNYRSLSLSKSLVHCGTPVPELVEGEGCRVHFWVPSGTERR